MPGRTVRGLKELTEEQKPLTSESIDYLRKQLWQQIEWPKFHAGANGSLTHGDSLKIKASRLRLPRLDYYTGRLVKTRSKGDSFSAVVAFQSHRGKIHAPVKADLKRKILTVTVPENATHGPVMLLMPIEERYGPVDKLSVIDRKHKVLRHYVGAWKDDSNACCSPETDDAAELCYFPKELESDLRLLRHVQFMIGIYWVRCRECQVECPHGAIEFDKYGDCYINKRKCLGEKYKTLRNEYMNIGHRVLFARADDEPCWECCVSDETVSRKCVQRRLRRVAYNSGVCCGNCKDRCKLDRLDFMELCDQGAIYRVAAKFNSSIFKVDPSLCTGCRQCYERLHCYNNHRDSTTVRMVAYIDPPKPYFEPVTYHPLMVGEFG